LILEFSIIEERNDLRFRSDAKTALPLRSRCSLAGSSAAGSTPLGSPNPRNCFVGELIESLHRHFEVFFFRVFDLVVADAVEAAK
jgi:hypothetical protein